MAIDRENNGDPASLLDEMSGRLRGPTPDQQRGTLANKLVKVADRIRALNARFGIRPYRVFLIHTMWTGGDRGVGDERVISRVEILPVPLVSGVGAISEVVRATGVVEEGDVSVEQISARFTEDDLLGRTPDIRDQNLPKTTMDHVDFFWEIVENRPQRPLAVIRRFAVRDVPELSRDGFQWTIRLVKQDYDRGRYGGTDRGAF